MKFQIGLALRTRPIIKLLARLLPGLFSTRSSTNYYYLQFCNERVALQLRGRWSLVRVPTKITIYIQLTRVSTIFKARTTLKFTSQIGPTLGP